MFFLLFRYKRKGSEIMRSFRECTNYQGTDCPSDHDLDCTIDCVVCPRYNCDCCENFNSDNMTCDFGNDIRGFYNEL